MADIKDELTQRPGLYPQINLNTGISFAGLALIVPVVIWLVSVKNDVGYHELRIVSLESSAKELRVALDAMRMLSAQAETRLENRLTRMEIILQDIRDNRRLPTPPP